MLRHVDINSIITHHHFSQSFFPSLFSTSFLYLIYPIGAHYCSRGLCSAKLKRIALALEDLDAAIEVVFAVAFTEVLYTILLYTLHLFISIFAALCFSFSCRYLLLRYFSILPVQLILIPHYSVFCTICHFYYYSLFTDLSFYLFPSLLVMCTVY